MSNKLFSAVVLSAEPYTKPLPDTVELVNYVSKFRTSTPHEITEDLAKARIASIALVRTPYMFMLDDDDSYEFMEVPTTGITQGLDYTEFNGEKKLELIEPWSLEKHMDNNLLMHHAVVYNTKALQAVCKKLPPGPLFCEWMMNVTMVSWKGVTVDRRITYTWERKSTGVHTAISPLDIRLSRRWMTLNLSRVIKELKEEDEHPNA